MKQSVFSLLLFLFSFGFFAQNTAVYTYLDKDFRRGIELFEKEKYAASVHFLEKYLTTNPYTEFAVDAQFYISW